MWQPFSYLYSILKPEARITVHGKNAFFGFDQKTVFFGKMRAVVHGKNVFFFLSKKWFCTAPLKKIRSTRNRKNEN
jgi:hypothetical protein